MTWAEAPQRVTTSCVHTVGFDQVVIAIALRFLLMPRILAVVIAAILSIGAASAQDAGPLTLDDAIYTARGMSPAIEAALSGVPARHARSEASRAGKVCARTGKTRWSPCH